MQEKAIFFLFSLTSKIPSSKLGGRKMLSSLAFPQKLVPPMKLEMLRTTIPCNDGSGIVSPSHSKMTLFSKFLYVLKVSKITKFIWKIGTFKCFLNSHGMDEGTFWNPCYILTIIMLQRQATIAPIIAINIIISFKYLFKINHLNTLYIEQYLKHLSPHVSLMEWK